MTTFTEARYGLAFGYVTGDSGWGPSLNGAAKVIGALMNCYLKSITTTATPSSPAEGDTYYVPAGATGAWSTHTTKIAAYQGGAWVYYTPPTGLRAYVLDATSFEWWNGTAWDAEVTSGGTVGPTLTGITSITGGDDIAVKGNSYSSGTHQGGALALYGGNTYQGDAGGITIQPGGASVDANGSNGLLLLKAARPNRVSTDFPYDIRITGGTADRTNTLDPASGVYIKGGDIHRSSTNAYGQYAGHVRLESGAAMDNNGEHAGRIFIVLGTSVSGTAGQLMMVNLPTADPHISGAVWANSGVLTVSAG